MNTVTDVFGSMVFNDSVMRARLPKDVFKQVQRSINEGKRLDSAAATVVANAMKDWAIEKGATHFTHWFQPMTGITAEKHDSFISPVDGGKVIMEFSGKELIQGEPDASSFPSGGLRATFEARGYTAWDPTSYAFIKDGVLCIPTAFCSYGGEALDKKTPLLRSMEAINKQGMRVIRLFGNTDVTSIKTTVGPEQEYFLIDKSVFEKRKDLMYTGRTLFGAKPPKGQELEDHYFGTIKPRVAAFMKELNEELWKLGVLAKTEHNEVAPAQHELAPIFTTTNIATDHNQLTMEIMQKVAKKHDMVCLLHEKPFAGVNGSGKHNNWSMTTNTGVNLLDPGDTPYENAQFLLFLCAVIQAVDDYQDMLRISVASAGNDHRLGANEAPPAVMSMFLGTELESILSAIERDEPYGSKEKELIKVGVHVLPKFPKDNTDRNRTSPFAFTGNKFEFRMLGSAASISGANVVLNTAVAESLRQYADILENSKDFENDLHELIKSVIAKHKRIIFNGNGYDDAWIEEAERRGLLNLKSTPDCVPYYLAEKNVELFTRHKIYTPVELHSRYEIKLDGYCKVLHIEALTMLDMVWKDILPAVSAYSKKLADTALAKKSLSDSIDCSFETELAAKISTLTAEAVKKTQALEYAVMDVKNIEDTLELARYYKDTVFAAMNELRIVVDELETHTSAEYWPYPSYGDILFSVK
ncbi:MAG: glutamine synthetase III [Candidatus Limivicinus sp.]|nr:glutamine synthetase III [Clostridiales bacterium]MDY6132971.1 glutamine synthetase III [Candidatus Limivicinus sp.]